MFQLSLGCSCSGGETFPSKLFKKKKKASNKGSNYGNRIKWSLRVIQLGNLQFHWPWFHLGTWNPRLYSETYHWLFGWPSSCLTVFLFLFESNVRLDDNADLLSFQKFWFQNKRFRITALQILLFYECKNDSLNYFKKWHPYFCLPPMQKSVNHYT